MQRDPGAGEKQDREHARPGATKRGRGAMERTKGQRVRDTTRQRNSVVTVR